MESIHVSDVRPKYAIASRLVETVLQILGGQIRIRLGAGQCEQQGFRREIGQLNVGRAAQQNVLIKPARLVVYTLVKQSTLQ